MNNSFFEQIQESAKYLGLDLCAQEMAQLAMEQQLTDESGKHCINSAAFKSSAIKRAKNI